MPRGYTDDDPAKGKPHRRVREKITLLLAEDTGLDPDLLKAALWRVADKRPEEVLDALCWVHEEYDEELARADKAAVLDDDIDDEDEAESREGLYTAWEILDHGKEEP